MPSHLEDLPPELLAYILSFCTLPSSLALARTSSWVRHTLKHSMQWAFPLLRCSIECQANVVYVGDPPREVCAAEDYEREWDMLGGIAGYDWSIGRLVPRAVWVQVLSQLTRGMLLQMELPRLLSNDWSVMARGRFAISLVRKELELVVDEVDFWYAEHTHIRRGRWKSTFLSHLNAFQHSATTGCHTEHNCHYVVQHRLAGLTENRTAFRTFDPLTIFRELKRENNLSRFTTIQLTIKDELVPRDLRVHVYCSIGRSDAFLKNEIAMEVLTRLGCWSEYQSTTTAEQAILGPVLITATIRPDPSTSALATTELGLTQMEDFVPLVDASLRRSDFLQVCEKVGIGRDWWAQKGVSQKSGLGFA
ncbi:BZ3500_MvSof-1268-A1-R1_Chr4-3g07363 [Microbotryum saponariae]|uniref:BZ3500_MvSof-1268-A1-R1_Chr4-3g07363 protein n=1 Tax=Microbotryum saponariae TaxID=289078 RepID=A0A2X0NLK2_9BASI|nr:BZ3500_MvSof-1268-A1-R1_Chr4-3g07363 [Microbotryum saponariae]SDA07026.1 BZ3501_MvSof-1269-A2-R1_Chr4-2g07072 [Microbotryum saponariae]